MSGESSDSSSSGSSSSRSNSSSSNISRPIDRDDVARVEPRVVPEVIEMSEPPQEVVPPINNAPLDARSQTPGFCYVNARRNIYFAGRACRDGSCCRNEVDPEPFDIPPTPHADTRDLAPLPRNPNEDHMSPRVIRSPSPALDVMPLRESILAREVPASPRDRLCDPDRQDVPSDTPSPKRHKSDKGKGVAGSGNEEPQSPLFMGVGALSHLSPDTIDKLTHRLSVCYKRLARAREEINKALKLNT
ncbi:hypothetical protein Salat_2149600 [Sesamum alatum]|uniref:Uncharacterized protein n=1 Tax=Sesamum alatum TaxID=300844 RepID=A0AAE1Y1L7_9LAMI|nr:hypothetical protein Salat_2149600 [Sesamum alatum]